MQTLKEKLSNLQVYRLGDIEIDVYVVGETPNRKFGRYCYQNCRNLSYLLFYLAFNNGLNIWRN
nr:nuclease A inhibitor family protein [Nostoc sp. LEGE 06077]